MFSGHAVLSVPQLTMDLDSDEPALPMAGLATIHPQFLTYMFEANYMYLFSRPWDPIPVQDIHLRKPTQLLIIEDAREKNKNKIKKNE